MKLVAVFPDIHHPYHDRGCMNAIFEWLEDYGKELSGVVLLGDQMDMDAVSHWLEGKVRVLEGKRIKKAYQEFDAEILTPIERTLSKKCKEKIYFIGNHEDWIEQAIDKNPQGEGYWEIDENLDLVSRGWKIIELNKTYKIGKLLFCHGLYTNQYHARKMVDTFGHSVIYGHTHDIQEHTKITPVDVNDVHKAKSIGCLCDLNPSYGKHRPNKWAHAFSIIYFFPDGQFNEYAVNIVNGKFCWNNKIYGA
jgi:hypothetical protein